METWVNVLKDHPALFFQLAPDLLERALAFIHIAEHDFAIEGGTLIRDKGFASLNNKSFCALCVAFDYAGAGALVLQRPCI
jgi:hypothetical protein